MRRSTTDTSGPRTPHTEMPTLSHTATTADRPPRAYLVGRSVLLAIDVAANALTMRAGQKHFSVPDESALSRIVGAASTMNSLVYFSAFLVCLGFLSSLSRMREAIAQAASASTQAALDSVAHQSRIDRMWNAILFIIHAVGCVSSLVITVYALQDKDEHHRSDDGGVSSLIYCVVLSVVAMALQSIKPIVGQTLLSAS